PALRECRHRGLARRLVAVRRPAVLMLAKGERPQPRLADRRGSHFHDSADDDAIAEHVEVVIVPLPGRTGGQGALEAQIVLVHFTQPTCGTSIRKSFGISDAPVSSILVRSAHGNSCVDGPRLARENVTCRTEVACSHVSGLFTQSLNDPNHSFTGHPFDTCR